MSTAIEIAGPALCAWRENRGGGTVGMQSVLNILQNRAARDSDTLYAEAIMRLQFSSMTESGNPELTLWPMEGDAQYVMSEQLTNHALSGELTDVTLGATDYYAPAGITSSKTFTLPSGQTIPFPDDWNEDAVQFTVEIAGQVFFKDV
jgi:hypothetical protein